MLREEKAKLVRKLEVWKLVRKLGVWKLVRKLIFTGPAHAGPGFESLLVLFLFCD